MSDSITLELISIAICLVFSGFFSGTETALTSLNELKIDHIISERGKVAKDLLIWKNNPNKVLNTILIGNNVVNILGSVLAADVTAKMFQNSQIAAVTGIMTLLVLIFGEITPKTFAKHNAVTISIYTMKLLKIFYIALYPFSYALNKMVKGLIKVSGGSLENGDPKITEDEIEYLIDVGGKEGVIAVDKTEMLSKIFDISEIYVKEVMVPRPDMVVIDIESEPSEIWKVIRETEYSRIPVFEEEIDNIIGILYVKDIARTKATLDDNFDFRSFLKNATFIPETKKIDTMLGEFQKSRTHIAIVIDEYGGVAGLLTLEDILEEIVGEIWDEYDTADLDIVQKDENNFILDVRLDIDDFCEKFDVEKTDEMEEYETLGGFIFDIAGKIPEEGEIYEYENYRFKILAVEDRKLDKVEVSRMIPLEADEDEAVGA